MKKYYYFCADCSDEIISDVELDEKTKCVNCGGSSMIDITPNEKLEKMFKDSVLLRWKRVSHNDDIMEFPEEKGLVFDVDELLSRFDSKPCIADGW